MIVAFFGKSYVVFKNLEQLCDEILHDQLVRKNFVTEFYVLLL